MSLTLCDLMNLCSFEEMFTGDIISHFEKKIKQLLAPFYKITKMMITHGGSDQLFPL